jgi:hypothetical protein
MCTTKNKKQTVITGRTSSAVIQQNKESSTPVLIRAIQQIVTPYKRTKLSPKQVKSELLSNILDLVDNQPDHDTAKKDISKILIEIAKELQKEGFPTLATTLWQIIGALLSDRS